MGVRSSTTIPLLGLAVLLGAVGAGSCGAASSGKNAATDSHVFVIVLENKEFEDVIGNEDAPYINRLAHRGALAVRYFAIAHPSLPNYLAIVGGSTFGIYKDCTTCSARGSNLALQLERAGVTWRAYMEGMPSTCYRGGYAGLYAKKHNPFAYFPSITGNSGRCGNVVPGTRLARDLRKGNLAQFSWITPDLCHDGHDCQLATSDRYLRGLVPKLLRRLGPQGFLVLTFDEGRTGKGCCGGAQGGRIATIFAGPGVRDGARLKRSYDHYTLLRTLEEAYSLSPIRGAALEQRSMRAAFAQFPSLR